MDNYLMIVISKLKGSWIIDINFVDEFNHSLFRQHRNTQPNFFEYYLNLASSPPNEYFKAHSEIGIDYDDFPYFYMLCASNKFISKLVEELDKNISKNKLTKNIYAFNLVEINTLANRLLKEILHQDAIIEIGGKGLSKFDKKFVQLAKFKISGNQDSHENSIVEKYKPHILRARELFDNNKNYQHISTIVRNVYMTEKQSSFRNIFDSSHKQVVENMNLMKKLYSDYACPADIRGDFLALGAFGFKSIKGPIYAGFLRILGSYDKNNRQFWSDFDLYLYESFKYSSGLNDVLNTIFYERYRNSTALLQYAPLRSIIPDGMYFPSDDYSNYTDIKFKVTQFKQFNKILDDFDVANIRDKYNWPKAKPNDSVDIFGNL